MLYQIFALTVKELKVLLRDREALILLFAMPLFFIFVMSWALQGVYEAGTKERPIKIALVNNDRGRRAAAVILDLDGMEGLHLIDSAEGRPLTIEKVQADLKKGLFPAALHFQENFSEAVGNTAPDSSGKEAPAILLADPGVNRQLLRSIQDTVQGVIRYHVLTARLGPMPQAPGLKGSYAGHAWLEVRLVSDFEHQRKPTATEQHIPAYTIFGVYFIVLTLASGLLREKHEGTFRRILTAPMTKSTLLVGKLIPYYIINLVQIGLMFLVGWVFYGVKLGNPVALSLVSLALAASANGLGLLVSAVGRTEAQVNGLSVLLAVTLGALGGMMVPSFIMPDGLRLLSRVTPHAWALAGYHDVMIRGRSILEILPECGVLAGFAVLFFAVALWRFRFD